jgi:acetyl-CoA carboxylase carboxyl transferase subunit alpha
MDETSGTAAASAAELETQLDELSRRIAQDGLDPHQRRQLAAEQRRLDRRFRESLSPLDRVRLARNPARPQTMDYVEALIADFFEIHGDRRYGDDGAIVAGLGFFGRRPVAIVGQQRGRSTSERIRRNFGKPRPEGYRKAARVFDLAGRFHIPLITFIDTQGAEPGLEAEERGQAEAIAESLALMARLETPVVACVIGEGGSGGALALGVGNVVLMQEYSCYSVITPEGCAAILWREAGPEKIADAARVLKLTAEDLLKLGVIDEIVPEPPGGAHRNPRSAIRTLAASISRHLGKLARLSPAQARRQREAKFAAMGTAYLTPSEK